MQINLYQQTEKKYVEVARERVQKYGKKEATLPELLAVIIGNTAKADVCGRLGALSVRELLTMTASDFRRIYGLSKIVSERLEVALALAKTVSELSLPERVNIKSSEDAYQVFKFLRHEEQEQLVVAFLNTKNELISRETVFVGGINSCHVHPREIFRRAYEKGATSIIIAHQHPSGNCLTPSKEDIDITRRLVESGSILGCELIDHILIGDGKFISMKDKGYMG